MPTLHVRSLRTRPPCCEEAQAVTLEGPSDTDLVNSPSRGPAAGHTRGRRHPWVTRPPAGELTLAFCICPREAAAITVPRSRPCGAPSKHPVPEVENIVQWCLLYSAEFALHRGVTGTCPHIPVHLPGLKTFFLAFLLTGLWDPSCLALLQGIIWVFFCRQVCPC